jgi:hypothetical protein
VNVRERERGIVDGDDASYIDGRRIRGIDYVTNGYSIRME